MGEVYLAEHRLLEARLRRQADPAGGMADPQALGPVRARGAHDRPLSHPNIVEIYDYGRAEDGTYYYVMEYLTA